MASGGFRGSAVRGRVFLLPVLAAAVAVSALAGVALGLWIHRQGSAAIDRAPGRSVVAAVQPGSGALRGTEGAAVPDTRRVRWTAPDGGAEEATIPLRSDPAARGLTRVRVDARGQLRSSSPDRLDVLSVSLITTIAWELVTAIAGFALYRRFSRGRVAA
ncbi:hypothetical protein CU254_15045 [Amycolatopsis sp. AA4]|uniref:hypothetical protein n=1 Tax=Actinomycetes TaxID=1760 RepID=UPI000C22AAE8|nr:MULTISPECIES: hypothetical protein [Actinomycetes]ATY11628.1 hypothetical protein CU254_15045 [Amycolatopsis sp. AA4]